MYYSEVQLIILLRAVLGLLHRVLALVLRHLGVDDLVHVQIQLIKHVLAVDDDVRQFLFYMGHIILRIAPLETLQQLIGLNGDGLGQIGGRMELIPVPVFRKFPDPVYGFLFHGFYPIYQQLFVSSNLVQLSFH